MYERNVNPKRNVDIGEMKFKITLIQYNFLNAVTLSFLLLKLYSIFYSITENLCYLNIYLSVN